MFYKGALRRIFRWVSVNCEKSPKHFQKYHKSLLTKYDFRCKISIETLNEYVGADDLRREEGTK